MWSYVLYTNVTFNDSRTFTQWVTICIHINNHEGVFTFCLLLLLFDSLISLRFMQVKKLLTQHTNTTDNSLVRLFVEETKNNLPVASGKSVKNVNLICTNVNYIYVVLKISEKLSPHHAFRKIINKTHL